MPLPVKSYQELLLWNPAPLQEIIGSGILYEQTKMVLFGGPKLGKSVLAQQIAICLAIGNPFIGFPVKTGSVLYIQAEISEVLFKDRIMKGGQGKPIPPAKLNLCTIAGFHLDKQAAIDELLRTVQKFKPSVLIIDPKYKFVSSNDENSIIRLTDAIDQCILNHGVATILIDHSRKPKLSNQGAIIDMGGFELRGPIIEQWADSIVRIKGDLASDLRILEFELRHAIHMLHAKQILLNRNTLWFEEIK